MEIIEILVLLCTIKYHIKSFKIFLTEIEKDQIDLIEKVSKFTIQAGVI